MIPQCVYIFAKLAATLAYNRASGRKGLLPELMKRIIARPAAGKVWGPKRRRLAV